MTSSNPEIVPTQSLPLPGRGLNAGLWVVQVLLAIAFAIAGFGKATTPIEELAQQMPWVVGNELLPRFIGIAELAGAIGLVVPAFTRIKPVLTPVAAASLLLVMLLAAGFHLSRGETGAVPVNLVLGGLAGFVAWGRFRFRARA